jgi:hypothetical protein
MNWKKQLKVLNPKKFFRAILRIGIKLLFTSPARW